MLTAHCWAGRVEVAADKYGYGSLEYIEAIDQPATCLLPYGHDGPHEWTPDEQIVVTFPASRP